MAHEFAIVSISLISPFQSHCETAVLYRGNHSIPLYTTLPRLQNVTYNMRDTVPYHATGHTTTTTTCFAYSGIASNVQSHQALDVGGAIQLNDQSHQTTNIPSSSFQDLVEMSSGQGTLYTTSTPVMSADPYDTISVEEISPISCPDQIFHQFHQNRMCLSYCQQFRTQVKIIGREITNLRRFHQCNTLESTPQNS